MALTKITGQVVDTTTDLVVGVTTVGGGVSAVDGFFSGITTISSSTESTSSTTGSLIIAGGVGIAKNLSIGGSVSIGGTLTYEDVTNVDAVGLITARNGIVVGSGITLSKDGDGFFTGIVTATTFVGGLTGNATGLTGSPSIACNLVSAVDGTFASNVTVGGNITIPDKIIHTDDTNTSIRFPSSDKVTVETAGTERLAIEPAGNVNLPKSVNVGTGLTVGGLGAGTSLSSFLGQGFLELTRSSGDAYIDFKDAILDDHDARIIVTSGGQLQFFTGGATQTKCAFQTSTGRVAIATDTSPSQAKLEIHSDKLGGTAGNTQELLYLRSPDISNSTTYRFTNYRKSDGTSHVHSEGRLRRHVDVTDQGFFGLGDGYVNFGYGTAEKARITSAGVLNIGESTPTASENGQFNCYTTSSSGKAQFVHAAGTGGLRLAGTGSGSGANLVFSNNYTSGTFSDHWTLTHNGGDDSFRFLIGGTAGNEAVRIKSDGSFGILQGGAAATSGAGEVTWPYSPLHVKYFSDTNSSGTGTYGQYIENYVGADLNQQKTWIGMAFHDDNPNNRPQVKFGGEVGQRGDANTQPKEGSGNFVVYTATGNSNYDDNATEKFVVQYNGTATISGSTVTSDARLKTDVTTLTGTLDKVKQLRGVEYLWNDVAIDNRGMVNRSDGEKQIGVIADEVKPIYPALVEDNGLRGLDGTQYKQVAYEKLVPILLEAIKELAAKVEALEG